MIEEFNLRICLECGNKQDTTSIQDKFVCTDCKRLKGEFKPSWIKLK